MSYRLSRHAGFCYGVSRALETVNRLLGSDGAQKVFLWGPVIHNQKVTDELASRGAVVAEDYSELLPGATVVVRAHGVAPDVLLAFDEIGLSCVDATCAHVRKSQLLARERAGAGDRLILVGDEGHPEIIGLSGWAGGGAYALADAQGVSGIPEEFFTRGAVSVIAQTTFDGAKYREIADALLARCPDCKIYDTICEATAKRQSAAAELSADSDVMLVIGSVGSANTRSLYQICRERCGECYLIETAGDLPPEYSLREKRIGITAGASTPDWIIEEVISKMEEMKRQDGDIDFAEEMESSLVTLQTGQTVKGRIIRYNNTEVYVDLGYKSDGVIPIDEFVTESEEGPVNNINIDDVIDVFVVRVNDSEGTVQLSKKRVDEKNNWVRIEEAFENNAAIKAIVTDVTNGGLIVTSGGVRIFVPASQVSDRYVEDLRGYLRKAVELRIIDYNKQKRKFVGSMKVLIIEEKRRAAEELWNDIEVGREYDGTVKSLTAFGAFVDIGGVDGLVHISELSWSRIKHPSDIVKVGDKVVVRVVSLDRDKKKISLGYRKEEDNPWYQIEEKYPVGTIVTKRVVRIAPFGAFVELERGVDALVHVSQISDTRIAKPDDVLHVGMEVTAKITELNLETKKISMSIKEVEPIPFAPERPEGASDDGYEDDLRNLPTQHVEEMRTTLGDAFRSAGGALPNDDAAAVETERLDAAANVGTTTEAEAAPAVAEEEATPAPAAEEEVSAAAEEVSAPVAAEEAAPGVEADA
ncbi:MAG: bifunctional 4-hydroxy-3-methylbut-2-enyl diphosphate reductase/30S ribosomal protein S1, partial [Clostridiales bacterium]|nr:bifunctional 4-hydroxy-3-methylbut-2-enyl diphosphate reductase/30S ribosomal protein S1 [Clostridiales bacterium]